MKRMVLFFFVLFFLSTAQADNLGAIGSEFFLLFLAILSIGLVTTPTTFIFSLWITFQDLTDTKPLSSKMKKMAWLSITGGIVSLFLFLSFIGLLGKEVVGSPCYLFVLPFLIIVPSIGLGICCLCKPLSSKEWLKYRILAWTLPVLLLFILFVLQYASPHLR